jgi:hypothetical protein
VNNSTQRLFVYSGFACLVLIGTGLLIFAGCVPPPSAANTAAEIARFYQADPNRVRLGLQLAMVGSALFIPFFVTLFLQMQRIEHRPSPWAYLQLACGTADMFVFILPLIILQAAIFRVDDIAPETMRTLNDMAWILFVSPASMIVLQMISVGAVVLGDKSSSPLLPRWVGYYNFWAALVSCCGITVPFFKNGPLAWNGVFTYWIPVAAFAGFIAVNGVALLGALRSEAVDYVDEESSRPLGTPS